MILVVVPHSIIDDSLMDPYGEVELIYIIYQGFFL